MTNWADLANTYDLITRYTNCYEFSTSKEQVAGLAKDLRVSLWTIEVGGLVNKPGAYTLEDLSRFGQEERVCRLRCVEAWSMVIPWLGFPLNELLRAVAPQSQAKSVRFVTPQDAQQTG